MVALRKTRNMHDAKEPEESGMRRHVAGLEGALENRHDRLAIPLS